VQRRIQWIDQNQPLLSEKPRKQLAESGTVSLLRTVRLGQIFARWHCQPSP
jgi:hypothetical protein